MEGKVRTKTDATGGFMQAEPRPWYERICSRLGFRRAHVERPDDTEDSEFAPGYALSSVHIALDWRDRLRALVSGQLHVETVMQMDAIPLRIRSFSAVGVMSPFSRHPKQR